MSRIKITGLDTAGQQGATTRSGGRRLGMAIGSSAVAVALSLAVSGCETPAKAKTTEAGKDKVESGDVLVRGIRG